MLLEERERQLGLSPDPAVAAYMKALVRLLRRVLNVLHCPHVAADAAAAAALSLCSCQEVNVHGSVGHILMRVSWLLPAQVSNHLRLSGHLNHLLSLTHATPHCCRASTTSLPRTLPSRRWDWRAVREPWLAMQ